MDDMGHNVIEHDRVLMIDLDGVIFRQTTPTWGSNDVVSGTVEWVNQKKKDGWYIVFWTGRTWEDYTETKIALEYAGFEYDELVCGKPVSLRTVIIDDKSVESITVKRNSGLKNVVIGTQKT